MGIDRYISGFNYISPRHLHTRLGSGRSTQTLDSSEKSTDLHLASVKRWWSLAQSSVLDTRMAPCMALLLAALAHVDDS